MKVDVCMWAKNGEKFLPSVLRRIDKIMLGDINQKIFVDDRSVDRSREIAKFFGWKVYHNQEGWISGGTKEALRHVETEFFVSVEQDVLLAKNWWTTIQKYMTDRKVAVAQGIYLSTTPMYRTYEEYRMKKVNQLPSEKRSQLCYCIGNNIYRTEVVKRLGFVDDTVAMSPFYEKIVNNGYKWITDTGLVSDHIRTSLFDAINHNTRFYSMTKIHTFLDDISLLRLLAGIPASIKFIRSRNAFVFLVSLLMKISYIRAYMNRRKSTRTDARAIGEAMNTRLTSRPVVKGAL